MSTDGMVYWCIGVFVLVCSIGVLVYLYWCVSAFVLMCWCICIGVLVCLFWCVLVQLCIKILLC
mgnify:CR=1 FL=1